MSENQILPFVNAHILSASFFNYQERPQGCNKDWKSIWPTPN